MHNNKSKEITSLSKFPTEVILHFYRKNRHCLTNYRAFVKRYNWNTKQYNYWIPFYGPFEKDGVIYNPICLGYTKSTGEECHKLFTKIMSKQDAHWDEDGYYYGYSEWQYGDEMNFRFEGMYWEGTIKQIKDELDKREHVGIFNNKDYRKWLIKYRKAKKC